MAVDILTDGEGYYLRQRGGDAAVRWLPGADGWEAERAAAPAQARLVSLGEVPAELREELLAFMARAASVGDVWKGMG